MNLEDIKEVRECLTQDDANGLLSLGNWRLINITFEKVKVPNGKEKVGEEYRKGRITEYNHTSDVFEVLYTEKLEKLYLLGRFA